MSNSRVCIGIDLGTSNCALALAHGLDEKCEIVPVCQVVDQGKVREEALLPSCLYIPHSGESAAGAYRLPWSEEATLVVGEYASQRGALSPDRLVSSAKSWLCNSHIDRRQALLPWKSDISEAKQSPVSASAEYLSHLKSAFQYALAKRGEAVTSSDMHTVVTVPASFDDVARTLTFEAAQSAGLGDVTLLEEPLAAIYAWISERQKEWRKELAPGDIILVCDVGGGTSDFTIIAVSEKDRELQLDRIAVGEHILLGGDNMDLALAFAAKKDIEASGKKLDRWQFLSLVHSCRKAKESLFSDSALDNCNISLAGKSSALFGATISHSIKRDVLESVILNGFFPLTAAADLPKARVSVGIQEWGLEYASDPAISKHLARFLKRALENVESDVRLQGLVHKLDTHRAMGFLRPNKVLFNGGVFNADSLRGRVLALLSNWCGTSISELPGAAYDLAVARGAALYSMMKATGKGIRVRSGTSRSYYLGIEASMPAVPGMEPIINALCIVPQGLEEGTKVELSKKEFGLVTGESVEFRFFGSTVRAGDRAGDMLEDVESLLEETSRLSIVLPAIGDKREMVPVTLSAEFTELGTLELWMHDGRPNMQDNRWKLEFNLRSIEA